MLPACPTTQPARHPLLLPLPFLPTMCNPSLLHDELHCPTLLCCNLHQGNPGSGGGWSTRALIDQLGNAVSSQLPACISRHLEPAGHPACLPAWSLRVWRHVRTLTEASVPARRLARYLAARHWLAAAGCIPRLCSCIGLCRRRPRRVPAGSIYRNLNMQLAEQFALRRSAVCACYPSVQLLPACACSEASHMQVHLLFLPLFALLLACWLPNCR